MLETEWQASPTGEQNEFRLAEGIQLGSNTPGVHPASIERPIHYAEWDQATQRSYRVSDHMINEPPPKKPFKIIMMGAGAAGIDFLHHAPEAFKDLDVEIKCYDKNPAVGGTVSVRKLYQSKCSWL